MGNIYLVGKIFQHPYSGLSDHCLADPETFFLMFGWFGQFLYWCSSLPQRLHLPVTRQHSPNCLLPQMGQRGFRSTSFWFWAEHEKGFFSFFFELIPLFPLFPDGAESWYSLCFSNLSLTFSELSTRVYFSFTSFSALIAAAINLGKVSISYGVNLLRILYVSPSSNFKHFL